METRKNFAGFSFPMYTVMLPKYPIAKRLQEYKAGNYSEISGYFRQEPNINPGGSSFYLESDFAPGLRWEWCDKVEGVRIDHTGWYSDEHGISDKIRGIVMRLPHGRGFLAGWSMGENMASSVSYRVYSDIFDCAHDADRMAEKVAEHEREYQEAHTCDQCYSFCDDMEERNTYDREGTTGRKFCTNDCAAQWEAENNELPAQ